MAASRTSNVCPSSLKQFSACYHGVSLTNEHVLARTLKAFTIDL